MTTLLFKTFVGIEFKEDSIIIACLKNDFPGLNLLSSSVFPLRDDDETIADIGRFITRYVRESSNVFVSIPRKWAVIKFMEVPSPKGKGKNALINMVRFEIERHIPYQIEDVSYDFQLMKEDKAACLVLCVAVHKEKIDYVKRFLEKLTLQPQIITISPFAILNSIEFSEAAVGGWKELSGITKKPDIWERKNATVISLFIDRDNAHFALLRDGSCVYINSFVLNLNKPPEAVVDDISSELATLPPQFPMEKINKMVLSGTIASLSELSAGLAAKLGIKVQTVNPVSKFSKGEEKTGLQALAASVGACYSGLGRGHLKINLLPHKADIMNRKTGTLITRISIPLIFLLIAGIFIGELLNDKRLLMKIEQTLKENEPMVRTVEKLTSNLSDFEQQRDFFLTVKEDDILLDALTELTNIMPAEAWLTDFNYKEIHDKKDETSKGELIIGGYALSSSALISILENSPYFEKVEFVGPVTKRLDKEGFKIKAVIVKPAR